MDDKTREHLDAAQEGRVVSEWPAEVAARWAEAGFEFDVCEDGGIVSEHGDDAAAAMAEAARLRLSSDASVVTVLVTSAASRAANS